MMSGRVNLEIMDFGVINKADISINKINVVGGINSSGKSTASKLLYCYLKSPDSPQDLLENIGFKNIDTGKITFSSDNSYSDIFYLESISVLDLKDSYALNLDYVRHVRECLESTKSNQNTNVCSKIEDIIADECCLTSSAGIKQIGLIQILLKNRSLRQNSFLIIDEPESNLHPAWQINFAQILVLLTKELNITLYLNSYSPIFIEAISLYAQYYDLLDQTSFYLTQKQDNNKFSFRKINPKNMGDVYENLTNPYDELDRLKAKIIFRE